MQEISCPNVISLTACQKTTNNYYLVLEHCNGGNLQEFIKARGGYLSEPEAKFIIRQIISGLKELRVNNVMHRDLKLANILVHFPNLPKERFLDPNFNLSEYIRIISFIPDEVKI